MAIRNFRWEDIPALANLENRIRHAQGEKAPASEKFLKEYFGQPHFNPEQDLFLAQDRGSLLASALVCHERPINRLVLAVNIDPDVKDLRLQEKLMDIALERGHRLGAAVIDFMPVDKKQWAQLLAKKGFKKIRQHLFMRWPVQKLPALEVPEGFVLRSYGQPGDDESLTRIQNAAFSGSFNFCPNTVEEIRYRANMSNTTHEGIIFLQDIDAVAGYNWTFLLPHNSGYKGVISMIGIDPAYRSRGLGKPLLIAGLEYLKSRGVNHVELEVDGENKPAIRLYKSVGFETAGQCHWFEASLDPSAPGGG